jgi:hypothetical protein
LGYLLDENYKNNVLKAISDEYFRIIISFLMERPKSNHSEFIENN